jgi:hypothetical protein
MLSCASLPIEMARTAPEEDARQEGARNTLRTQRLRKSDARRAYRAPRVTVEEFNNFEVNRCRKILRFVDCAGGLTQAVPAHLVVQGGAIDAEDARGL